jgi:hypothetical protein
LNDLRISTFKEFPDVELKKDVEAASILKKNSRPRVWIDAK